MTSETKPFSLQSPETIAKEYGGNKQKIAQAVQNGLLDPTSAVLAGMFIDRMRSAQAQEQAQQQTVAQQVLAPQAAQAPGLQAIAPQGAPQIPQQAQPTPQITGADPQGGLEALPVDESMFTPSYNSGGIVAFAGAGAVSGGMTEKDYKRLLTQGLTPEQIEKYGESLIRRNKQAFEDIPAPQRIEYPFEAGNVSPPPVGFQAAPSPAAPSVAPSPNIVSPTTTDAGLSADAFSALPNLLRSLAGTSGAAKPPVGAYPGVGGAPKQASIAQENARILALQSAMGRGAAPEVAATEAKSAPSINPLLTPGSKERTAASSSAIEQARVAAAHPSAMSMRGDLPNRTRAWDAAITPYNDEIQKAAAQYGLDPVMFKRLIGSESSFNPSAASYKGAQYGLGIAQLNKDKGLTDEQRKDPAQALPVAAKYLASLIKQKGGDAYEALMAYKGARSEKGRKSMEGVINEVLFGLDGKAPQTAPATEGQAEQTAQAKAERDPAIEAYLKSLDISPEEIEKRKNEDFWSAVAQFGFNMASSKSPSFLQAAGEAGKEVLPTYAKARKEGRTAQEKALESKALWALTEQKRVDDLAKELANRETQLKVADIYAGGKGAAKMPFKDYAAMRRRDGYTGTDSDLFVQYQKDINPAATLRAETGAGELGRKKQEWAIKMANEEFSSFAFMQKMAKELAAIPEGQREAARNQIKAGLVAKYTSMYPQD